MEVFLSLGSNVGNRDALLQEAYRYIQEMIGEVKAASIVLETAPWGYESHFPYLNQVLMVETLLRPEKLLEVTLQIEHKLGRERKMNGGYADRTIDIDILIYGQQMIHTNRLQIPHPRMHLRSFTLIPMTELAPDYVHPVLEKTMMQLLNELSCS